jgi:hypothetical protein
MSDSDFKSMKEQASREEIISALFANMVMQQANMALMFLGKVPNPQTGEHVKDLDMAQLFIDHLEMLEEKTKGNLNQQEQGILKQSLMAARMAFVEASQSGAEAPKAEPAPAAAPNPPPAEGQPQPAAESAADEETRKKFSKKY